MLHPQASRPRWWSPRSVGGAPATGPRKSSGLSSCMLVARAPVRTRKTPARGYVRKQCLPLQGVDHGTKAAGPQGANAKARHALCARIPVRRRRGQAGPPSSWPARPPACKRQQDRGCFGRRVPQKEIAVPGRASLDCGRRARWHARLPVTGLPLPKDRLVKTTEMQRYRPHQV